MSKYLDEAARLDAQRAADLIANDEAQKQWVEADARYLATQADRIARRQREAADLERRFSDRLGWMV
jgi:hypothetical protein